MDRNVTLNPIENTIIDIRFRIRSPCRPEELATIDRIDRIAISGRLDVSTICSRPLLKAFCSATTVSDLNVSTSRSGTQVSATAQSSSNIAGSAAASSVKIATKESGASEQVDVVLSEKVSVSRETSSVVGCITPPPLVYETIVDPVVVRIRI